jgi:release factor glutamine methyltransferase
MITVGDGVFIPRPETELLVDAVLPTLRAAAAALAVDLCAGSGALALAIADEVPATRVWAVENSPAALTWLRRNAVGTDVEIVDADVRDPGVLAELAGTVDAVVSNPPYVPASTEVSPEVRADPPRAVFAGSDGLSLIPHVLARAAELLRPGGLLAIEHDETHAPQVAGLLEQSGHWHGVEAHYDLAGRPRYAVAIRR